MLQQFFTLPKLSLSSTKRIVDLHGDDKLKIISTVRETVLTTTPSIIQNRISVDEEEKDADPIQPPKEKAPVYRRLPAKRSQNNNKLRYFKCHLCGFRCLNRDFLIAHFSVAHPT